MKTEPIIIGGCGSSGTTLIRKMLNAHKNIACGPEMSVFDRPQIYKIDLDWLYTMFRSGDFDPLDKEMIFPLRMQPANFSYFGLHPDNHGRFYHDETDIEAMFDQVNNVRDFFDLFFSRYAQKQGASRWAEKTPNNLFCIDQIFDWFPNAHFLIMIRDGRDVVISLTERRQVHSIVAIFRWLVSAAAFLKILDEQPQYIDRIIRVNYEDLVKDPERELRKICARIGEDFDPAMLKYYETRLPEDIATEQKNNPIESYAKQPVFADSVGKWKKEINPTIDKMMRLTMRDYLLRLGYEDWKTTDQN